MMNFGFVFDLGTLHTYTRMSNRACVRDLQKPNKSENLCYLPDIFMFICNALEYRIGGNK